MPEAVESVKDFPPAGKWDVWPGRTIQEINDDLASTNADGFKV